MNETLFEVAGADGLMRRGIVTGPQTGSGMGIVLLPAGLKYHIGPGRFNVLLARSLAAAGHTVLRIDPIGMGESDGHIEAGATRELWRSVEQGRFVDDTLLACREFRRCFGLERIIVAGICGGAITGQLAAARARGVIDGVVSLNTAVTLSPIDANAAKPMGAVQAQHHMKSYLRKLLAPAAWRRLFSGESDIAGIGRIVVTAVKTRIGGGRRTLDLFPNENPAYLESFRTLERNRIPHLLLFSGNDNRWLEFQEIVLQRYLNGNSKSEQYEIGVIADANHEFHWRAWQQEAFRHIGQWIERTFVSDVISARVAS
ncbi:MAG: alpha/beta fold hydrolase [Gammaproteobacteria bacterium]|nr:alpha/beta fold hydrolase [Gammaproteobacteria bacterium]